MVGTCVCVPVVSVCGWCAAATAGGDGLDVVAVVGEVYAAGTWVWWVPVLSECGWYLDRCTRGKCVWLLPGYGYLC